MTRKTKERKRIEARQRQESFNNEVARIAQEQNIDPETARQIAKRSRKFDRDLQAKMSEVN